MKLYGKQNAAEKLSLFMSSGRMPHAIMFTGDEGAGKRTMADYTAMLMLCTRGQNTPCMTCNECGRIEAHIHPDVVYPLQKMTGGKYNVDDMVRFITSCNTLPNDSPFRVAIFENADTMNLSCQNALLKFIEEPLRFNRFVFTVSDKSRILETIFSRVAEIKISPAEIKECTAALTERGIAPDEAEKLSRTFGGNIGKCLTAHENEGALTLLKISEKIALAAANNREYDCMAGLCKAKNREELGVILKNLTDIFGNAAAVRAGGRPYGCFSSETEEISRLLSLKKASVLYDTALGMLREIDFNPNVQLAAAACCAKMFDAAENAEK